MEGIKRNGIIIRLMETKKRLKYSPPIKVIVKGGIAVLYFGDLIALVDDRGKIIWRNGSYPLFLIEYLIEYPTPQSEWN